VSLQLTKNAKEEKKRRGKKKEEEERKRLLSPFCSSILLNFES